MQRDPVLPCLPGFDFNKNLGRTKFHRNQYFAKIHDGVYYLSEKTDTGDHIRYPSIYARGEVHELPSWIAYDGQLKMEPTCKKSKLTGDRQKIGCVEGVASTTKTLPIAYMNFCGVGFANQERLMFKAFFQETVQERWKTAYQIRVVNISFFLEDGTMKISEPVINNSGLEQGVLLRRQRIPMPDPVRYRYYDIIDLNVGKELEIFGRVYKVVDCDKFTRTFLNRMGIPVPDPINIPKDPSSELRKFETFPKKPNRRIDTRGDFLKYDKQVLRFYGYWDDTENLYGIIHDLDIHYYLADDTIEIKENVPPNSGRDSGFMFLRRMKVPKLFVELDPIGAKDPFTVLNVMGEDASNAFYTIDPLGTGKTCQEFYKSNELGIGAEINVFGRRIIITDMDAFTKEYYRQKYGLNDFTPLERPRKNDEVCGEVEKYIPPYNGFGSYEDSLGNCFSVLPKPPKIDIVKFLHYDKQGFDSYVFRFRAKLISNIPENKDRSFIIRVFLMDDTISIFELGKRNSGFKRCLFQKKTPVMLPNQEIFTSEKPKYYTSEDFYIGARVTLNGFCFELTSADIYALRYMELNCDKYPKANAKLIMAKLREILKPVYKEFIQLYAPSKSCDGDCQVMSYENFRNALYKYSEGKLTEHEVITIARHFTSAERKEFYNREYIRRLIHTEILRNLWDDLDRLEEDLHHWDRKRSGYLSRDTVFTVLRGARIPADIELINSMLDHIHKNEESQVDYNDLLKFMNTKIDPVPPVEPINIKSALWWASEKEPDTLVTINWCAFLKELDIKDEKVGESYEPSDMNISSNPCNKFMQ